MKVNLKSYLTTIITLVKWVKPLKVENLRDKDYKKLMYCLIFDGIGTLTALFPFFDFIWAPISGGILLKMFGWGLKGKVAAIVGFTEEFLPSTSILPTFTLSWFYENFIENKSKNEKSTWRFLQRKNNKE